MTEFDVLDAAAGAMRAQRAVLDVAARNVAAAQASTPDHPYPRLVAQLVDDAVDDDDGDDGGEPADSDGAPASRGLRFVGTRTAPGSADALGEMIAVLDAQRAYEQNATLFDVGKRMAERTLDVGRG